MATKKPAKPMAGQTKQVAQDPTIYGTMLKFHGSKTAPSICPSCGTKTVKGMVRVKAEKYFCSASCAKSFEV